MIVSASRRTDIPRWYAPWLMNRLRAGEVMVREPYRPHRLRRYALTPEGVDAVVFWTKDPRPLLPHLDELEGMGFRRCSSSPSPPTAPTSSPAWGTRGRSWRPSRPWAAAWGGSGCCGGMTRFC